MQKTKIQDHIFNPAYECLSRSEMQNLQSERLRKTVERVYNNCAPYRKKMDELKLKPSDVKSVSDLYKLPFTVKHDLREAYPFGFYSSPAEDIVEVHASSGTTGKLTVVGYSRNDLEVWSEIVARGLSMAGVTKDSMVHVAYGYGLFTGGLGAHYGAQKIGASTVPASAGNTIRQLTLLRDFGATHLCCTPSYAIFLGTEIEKAGMKIEDFSLVGGAFGAEPWTDNMRREIERTLHIDALDIYGLSEICGPGVAMECLQKSGSHVQEDHFIPEIIDPETLEPLPFGSEGELVFTTITKTGQPLIRYRTRDLCTLSNEKCACGRTTVKMGRVKGRSDDMLIVRGVNVFPSQIEAAIMNVAGVSPHYMIYVDRVNNLDTMEIHIELAGNIAPDMVSDLESIKKKVETEVNSYIGVGARIKLCESGSIQRSEGKAQRVVDRRK
ncbi:phenylacetate--CoA ligase [Candidatus Borkfalkia ceftriaxoniphila]|uniref:Phenylacetate-coenzyme A ligase n=1 Tax=Candidatus Borkfalkia ceftriaxoniphila TaxID=2508949 RepID=A0A4Q2KEU0_9FIRM|nr:phenylacetate--CoA ligase [Candidatus Borkfalkia ceftriaxoniphila]RXZ62410.1 phenylacetate--CoA ligase [Candidatus Borkfalkia ceftriaxoniphila]